MLKVSTEDFGDLAVIECQGRIVQSDAAFKVRRAVISRLGCRSIVLDLTEVEAIEGGGLGMLSALQKLAEEHRSRLLLFNPAESIRTRLTASATPLSIVSFEEMMTLFERANARCAQAA